MADGVKYGLVVTAGLIAAVLALFGDWLDKTAVWIFSVQILLGLIAGLFYLERKQLHTAVVAGVLLAVVAFAGGAGATLGGVGFIGPYLKGFFNAGMAFVVPCTLAAGFKEFTTLFVE
ncbi:hypothetical protein HZB01_04380 [Candidatus Woesearchaeota archaeon]|nr:hypothetical protein [Candidatus Woesearchaeota archaeon]